METILNEYLHTYPAYPRPAYSTFNGSDEWLSRAVSNFNSSRHTGYIKTFWNFVSGNNIIFQASNPIVNNNYIGLQVANGRINFLIYKSGTLNQVRSSSGVVSNGWHEIEFGTTTGTNYYMKLDGVSISFTVVTSDNGDWFADGTTGKTYIQIGKANTLSPAWGVGGGAYVEVDGTNKWILTGNGKYIYDVIGNLHLTYAGTGSRVAYDKQASWHLLKDYGYSLFKKNGELNEYVPYNTSTGAQSPSELSTYTRSYDIAGNSTDWNFAPGALDFNPSSMAENRLDVFNKANSTIHIATSGMSHYNSSFPYEWTSEELFDFSVYNGYFNADYQNRLFNRINGNLLKEILNYKTKKTGTNLTNVKSYCGIL